MLENHDSFTKIQKYILRKMELNVKNSYIYSVFSWVPSNRRGFNELNSLSVKYLTLCA